MNKKVLTLCAGFLLAGGMLSTLSAEKLSAVANDGKYYKISRVAEVQDQSGSLAWIDQSSSDYWLGLDKAQAGITNRSDLATYWKVDKYSDTYVLTSLSGQQLIVSEYSNFTLKEDNTVSTNSSLTFSQLFMANVTDEDGNSLSVGQEATGENNFWKLVKRTEDGTNTVMGEGFSPVGTELALTSANASYPQSNVVYTISYEDENAEGNDVTISVNGGQQYKISNSDNGYYSLVENSNNENVLYIDGVTNFQFKKVANNHVLLVTKSGAYVTADVDGKLSLTSDIAKAKLFAFEEVTAMTALNVGQLTYYDLDGFSVSITYGADKKTLEGDEFVGHLTPMTYTNNRFVNASDDVESFYLKNEEGKYIVAVKTVSGSTPVEDIYTFTTVDESALLHNLSIYNDEKQRYFGLFTAYYYDYELDVQKLTSIDRLTVNLGTGYNGTVGHCQIKGKETLAVSAATGLEAVNIALNAPSLVQAKDLLLQKKFFTVVRKGSSNPRDYVAGYVVATGYNKAGIASSYGNPLEGQWAITYDTKSNEYTFTNRENDDVSFTLDGNKLYTTNVDYAYRQDHYTNGVWQYTDTLVIAPVPEHAATDGYETLKNLKNVKFNIGYASGVYGNAWFTENHEGVNNHTIGLDTDAENALVFTATEYADAKKRVETPVHGYVYVPSDSIYVVSEIGYINAKNEYKTDKDTLKVVSYSFVNQWNEPLIYAGIKDKYVSSVNEKVPAQKFALRQDGERLNLRPVYLTAKESYSAEGKMYNEFDNVNDLKKMYAGDAANGILDNVTLYDRTENDYFVVEPTDVPMYRPVINPLDTISIYRNDNSRSLLYEKGEFLGMENIADFTDMNPAFLADTAYVRYDTYRPQYMLVVGAVKHDETTYCPDHGIGATCLHADTVPGWVEGRYLVNLKDTAIAWDEANKHKDGNPYINSEKFYKLGFVQAKHIGDSLMIEAVKPTAADTINVGTEDFNVAKFAFRYVDTEAQSFVIETANYKKLNERNAGARDGEGYLKWMNGVVVVVDDIENADVYNMNEDEDRTPTANEAINAEGAISVVATDGAVIIKGAEGKNVVIATILGKVVANETVNSDNETIAVPAGIAVVSVDGESFKVVVK